jgi:hypothetical protein
VGTGGSGGLGAYGTAASDSATPRRLSSAGKILLELCASARERVVLVSPFMKQDTVRRLLDAINHNVTLVCVTRWKPEEVRAGVTDLNVFDLLTTRTETSLLLRADLHAKYYRADSRVLIGSANLTAAALGWANRSNFEILEPFPTSLDWIQSFEASLLVGAIPANEEIRQRVEMAAEALDRLVVAETDDPLKVSLGQHLGSSYPHHWLPSLRNPEEPFVYYAGGPEQLSVAAREAAGRDLQALRVPAGLIRVEFEKYVSAMLLQMPFVQQVDAFVQTPRRFGEIRDLIQSDLGRESREAGRLWQTLMRWMLYFFPERYERTVPRQSEVFARRIL